MPSELPETLRERVERIYRFELMDDPLALELAKPESRNDPPPISTAEWIRLSIKMAGALRETVFDLAEQVDVLLGGQIKPE